MRASSQILNQALNTSFPDGNALYQFLCKALDEKVLLMVKPAQEEFFSYLSRNINITSALLTQIPSTIGSVSLSETERAKQTAIASWWASLAKKSKATESMVYLQLIQNNSAPTSWIASFMNFAEPFYVILLLSHPNCDPNVIDRACYRLEELLRSNVKFSLEDSEFELRAMPTDSTDEALLKNVKIFIYKAIVLTFFGNKSFLQDNDRAIKTLLYAIRSASTIAECYYLLQKSELKNDFFKKCLTQIKTQFPSVDKDVRLLKLNAIANIANAKPDKLQAIKREINNAIDEYLNQRTEEGNNPNNRNPHEILNDRDIGLKRAQNFKHALTDIDNTHDLLELLWLLKITAPTQTRNPLATHRFKDAVFKTLDITDDGFEEYVSTDETLHDFKDCRKKDAEAVFSGSAFLATKKPYINKELLSPLFKENLIKAINEYLAQCDQGKHDIQGRIRAQVLAKLLIEDSEKKLTPQEAEKQLITTICALVFRSGSRDLKKLILTWCGLTESRLKELQYALKISDYAIWKKERIINATKYNLTEDKLLPILKRSIKFSFWSEGPQVALYYEHAQQDAIKNTIARVEKTDSLLDLCIVLQESNLTGISKEGVKKYLKEIIEIFPSVSQEAIKRIVNTDINIIKDKILLTIKNYAKESDKFSNFCQSISEAANHNELLEILYLLEKNASSFFKSESLKEAALDSTSTLFQFTRLKDIVFESIGLVDGALQQYVNDHENLYGHFNNFSASDAKMVIENASPVKLDTSLSERPFLTQHDLSQLFNRLRVAIDKYKSEKKRDKQGLARANYLLKELNEIESLPDPVQKEKKLVTLLSALVFKSGSKILKEGVLNGCALTELSLKNYQNRLQISEYAIWKKARAINVITTVDDWSKFRDHLIDAITKYKKSGIGGEHGNIRADNALRELYSINISDVGSRENQYQMVLIAYTLACEIKNFKGNITRLGRIVLNRLSQIHIDEAALKNLNEQLGISKKAIKQKTNILNGMPVDDEKETVTDNESLVSDVLTQTQKPSRMKSEEESDISKAAGQGLEGDTAVPDDDNDDISQPKQSDAPQAAASNAKKSNVPQDPRAKAKERAAFRRDLWPERKFSSSDLSASDEDRAPTPPPAAGGLFTRTRRKVDDDLSVVAAAAATESGDEFSDVQRDWLTFKNNLSLAVSCFLDEFDNDFISKQTHEDSISRAYVIKEIVENLKTADQVNDVKTQRLLVLLVSAVIHSKADILKDSILSNLGMTKAQIIELQTRYEISDEVCEVVDKKLLKRDAGLRTVYETRFTEFPTNTTTRLSPEDAFDYVIDNYKVQATNYHETQRRRNLLMKLQALIPTNNDENKERAVAVLICTTGIYFDSILKDNVKNVLGEKTIENLQIKYNITKAVCEEVIDNLYCPISEGWDEFKKRLTDAINTEKDRSLSELPEAARNSATAIPKPFINLIDKLGRLNNLRDTAQQKDLLMLCFAAIKLIGQDKILPTLQCSTDILDNCRIIMSFGHPDIQTLVTKLKIQDLNKSKDSRVTAAPRKGNDQDDQEEKREMGNIPKR